MLAARNPEDAGEAAAGSRRPPAVAPPRAEAGRGAAALKAARRPSRTQVSGAATQGRMLRADPTQTLVPRTTRSADPAAAAAAPISTPTLTTAADADTTASVAAASTASVARCWSHLERTAT